ncbi:MAG: type restriction enzyme protein [Verrucomicrobiota bacterium]|jgi:PAS domain S-box-containing protein
MRKGLREETGGSNPDPKDALLESPSKTKRDTRIEQAETRMEQAESRIERTETQSEQALRASELSYRRLFEAARDGILILDVDTGRISDVNPFLTELLGFSHAEMVGKTVGELSPFKDIESNKVMLERLQKDGYVRYEDLPLETRDGRHVDVEFVSNVYQAGDRNVIQCNIRNITERKRAEGQMRDVQTQLEQTNRDLTKRSQEVQYFYHTLSHELKTPLTAAREFVSIVIDGLAGELNSTQLNYLRIAKRSCTELAVYINDLLDATRLDTGKLHLELKAASLAAIIRRAIAITEPIAARKTIRLSEELDTDLTDVMVDESRIMQILTNLLNNALKFTFEGGAIVVTLAEYSKNSECVQISVTDNGCGIAKDKIDNLFHRFYQIKNGDATPEKGVGLGLYLCRQLVLMHGGSIWVESTLGQGSTFSFTIPKQESKHLTVPAVPLQSALNEGINK